MISLIYWSIVNFIQILLLFGFFGFIIYHIFQPIHNYLINEKNFKWINACLLINFLVFFIVITIAYLVPFISSLGLGPAMEEFLVITPLEYLIYFLTEPLLRIILAAVILSLIMLFFEFLVSLFLDMQDEKKYNLLLKEVIAVLGSTAIFIFLLLFVFDWVPLGLYVFIFFGGVGSLPAPLFIVGGLLS